MKTKRICLDFRENKNIMTVLLLKRPSDIKYSIWWAFLAYTKQKVSNIVGLTALRLAFLMGYE